MDSESRLLGVFQSVFGEDLAEIKNSDAVNGLPGWDSAGHLNLIMAIEAEFDIQFDIVEMESLTDVGAIRDRLPST